MDVLTKTFNKDCFNSIARVSLTTDEIRKNILNKPYKKGRKYTLCIKKEKGILKNYYSALVILLSYRKIDNKGDIELCFVEELEDSIIENRMFYYYKLSECGNTWVLFK